MRLGTISGLCSSFLLAALPALTGPVVVILKKSTSAVLSDHLRHNQDRRTPAGCWSCSRFRQSLLESHCSILRFLTVPPTPPRSHAAHGCFLPLPPHSLPCLDGEAGEAVTAFIVISTVDDLTWGFSLLAAWKLTAIEVSACLVNLAELDQPAWKVSGESVHKSHFLGKPSFI